MGIIEWLIVGLLAGFIARAVVPGRDRMSVGWTIVLGLAGSIVGGLVGVALTRDRLSDFTASGLLGSIVGAVILLLIIRKVSPGRLGR